MFLQDPLRCKILFEAICVEQLVWTTEKSLPTLAVRLHSSARQKEVMFHRRHLVVHYCPSNDADKL